MNPEFRKYEDHQAAVVVKQLLDIGIEAQYISDEIVKHAFDYERLFDYPTDNHPDLGTTDVMTSLMADRLQLFNFQKTLDPSLFSKEYEDASIGIVFVWPSGVNIGEHTPNEPVKVPRIIYNEEKIYPDPESQILVLGNSFIGTPYSHAYISCLAEKLLYTSFSQSMGGAGAVTGLLKRILLNNEKLLKGKTVAILPIGIAYLTGTIQIPNLSELDGSLKVLNQSNYLSTVPIREYCSSSFSSSTDFNFVPASKKYNDTIIAFIEMHPNAVLLSESQPVIEIPIPKDINPKMCQISICPIRYDAGTSCFVDNKEYLVNSNENPKWETIQIEIEKNQKSIMIHTNKSHAKLLLGNVSFYN